MDKIINFVRYSLAHGNASAADLVKLRWMINEYSNNNQTQPEYNKDINEDGVVDDVEEAIHSLKESYKNKD